MLASRVAGEEAGAEHESQGICSSQVTVASDSRYVSVT